MRFSVLQVPEGDPRGLAQSKGEGGRRGGAQTGKG